MPAATPSISGLAKFLAQPVVQGMHRYWGFPLDWNARLEFTTQSTQQALSAA